MSERMQELKLRQLEEKLEEIEFPGDTPDKGWIHSIRSALGMTLAQLAERIGVSRPTVSEYEERETKETITLKTLKKAGEGLGCKLVYALLPEGKSLQEFREKKAREAAEVFVGMTSHSMSLENQDVTEDKNEQQIKKLKQELLDEWDNSIWEVSGSIGDKEENSE